MTSLLGDVHQALATLEAIMVVVAFAVLVLVPVLVLAGELRGAKARQIGRMR